MHTEAENLEIVESELTKLKNYLDKHGIVNERHTVIKDWDQVIVYKEYDGDESDIDTELKEPWEFVKVFDKWYRRSWDAVCHKHSYGGPQGLLEIYGDICDDVVGWLTAEDVITKYIEKKQ